MRSCREADGSVARRPLLCVEDGPRSAQRPVLEGEAEGRYSLTSSKAARFCRSGRRRGWSPSLEVAM